MFRHNFPCSCLWRNSVCLRGAKWVRALASNRAGGAAGAMLPTRACAKFGITVVVEPCRPSRLRRDHFLPVMRTGPQVHNTVPVLLFDVSMSRSRGSCQVEIGSCLQNPAALFCNYVAVEISRQFSLTNALYRCFETSRKIAQQLYVVVSTSWTS